ERSDAVALESRHLPRPRVLGRAPAAQRDNGQPRRLGEAVPAGAAGRLARARQPAVPLLTSLMPSDPDSGELADEKGDEVAAVDFVKWSSGMRTHGPRRTVLK